MFLVSLSSKCAHVLSLWKIFLFYDDNVNQLRWLTSDQKRFWRGYIEAYNIEERRVKSNNKTPFYRKILIFFADNIGLIRSDLVRFEQILCFSKIEGSIIP